eukprot:SAG25_NODE_300_length_10170_cov_17.968325_6_plen_230_part_00
MCAAVCTDRDTIGRAECLPSVCTVRTYHGFCLPASPVCPAEVCSACDHNSNFNADVELRNQLWSQGFMKKVSAATSATALRSFDCVACSNRKSHASNSSCQCVAVWFLIRFPTCSSRRAMASRALCVCYTIFTRQRLSEILLNEVDKLHWCQTGRQSHWHRRRRHHHSRIQTLAIVWQIASQRLTNRSDRQLLSLVCWRCVRMCWWVTCPPGLTNASPSKLASVGFSLV